MQQLQFVIQEQKYRRNNKKADIVISAIGKPKFVKENMVKDGAVVIDVGINRLEDGSIVGDVDFDEVSKKQVILHLFQEE